MAIVGAVAFHPPNVFNLRAKLGGFALSRGNQLQRTGSVYRARYWLLFANVLSAYDMARAVARSRLSAVRQAFGIVLGLVGSLVFSSVAGWPSWLIFVAGLAFSAVDFRREINGLRTDDVRCDVIDVSGDPARSAALAAAVTPENLLSHKSYHALYVRAVNAELSRQSDPGASDLTVIDWSNDTSPLPKKVEDLRRQVLLSRYRKAKSNRPFNGELVKQVTDTEVITSGGGGALRMRPTRYFELMCSNYITESIVEDRRTGARELDGLDLVRDRHGALKSLAGSDLANGVGVSTLAFDSRKRLILIQQAEFAQSSGNLWAPSGSGSLEPGDLFRSPAWVGSDPSLVDVIRRGMNRELIEESHIPEGAVADSRVTGYFRWLNKGAKPEYVGVTLLDRPVTGLRRRMSEFRWVRSIEVGVAVDFELLEARPEAADDCLGENYQERERFKLRMSFPLYVALVALGERLRDDPEFKSWFEAAGPR